MFGNDNDKLDRLIEVLERGNVIEFGYGKKNDGWSYGRREDLLEPKHTATFEDYQRLATKYRELREDVDELKGQVSLLLDHLNVEIEEIPEHLEIKEKDE